MVEHFLGKEEVTSSILVNSSEFCLVANARGGPGHLSFTAGALRLLTQPAGGVHCAPQHGEARLARFYELQLMVSPRRLWHNLLKIVGRLFSKSRRMS